MTEQQKLQKLESRLRVGGIIDPELDKLAKNIGTLACLAQSAQTYRPLQVEELKTTHGRGLYTWLRYRALAYTPFGINYICETNEREERKVQVSLDAGTVKDTELYATAGIYLLEHSPHDQSINACEVGLVASFKDLIKVYSLNMPDRPWPDLIETIKKTMMWAHGEEELRDYKMKDMPVCYEKVPKDREFNAFMEGIIIELAKTGFEPRIDIHHSRSLCKAYGGCD